MPYFYKNKDRRKNIVILGTEMLILFLQKNGIIIVKIKKGSGELSFFYFSIKEVADAHAKSFNNNIKEGKATVNLRIKKSFSKKNNWGKTK